MTSEEYGQYIDDFELDVDVMPGESLTEYIERRRREFDSKADGGSIGIEVLFGPKREEYQTGGISVGGSTPLATYQRQGYQLQKNPPRYDSRATAQDFANALKNVSAGTTYQQQADAQRYARNKANEMLTQAFRSGNINQLANQFNFKADPSLRFEKNRSGIYGLTQANRENVLKNMAQQMLSYPMGGSSAPPKKSPLQLKIEENQRIYDEYIKNNPPVLGVITGPQGGAPTPPKPEYEDQALLSKLTMLTPEEAFGGETFETLSDLDQYNFAQAYTQFKPQLRDPTYVSPYGAPSGRDIFARRYGIKDGGRVPMVSGGFLKGLGSLFKGGDKAADLAKQEEIFRSGPITKEFLETVDSKVINPFVRSRDAKGVGSYGLYDNFDDMPAGLKAAEIIKRFVNPKTGKINYEDAEFFIGRKLKGDETINELIEIAISKPIGMGKGPFKDFEEYVLGSQKKADGGRVGLFMGGDPLTGQALQIYNSMKGYNFTDQEIADALSARGLYTNPGSTPTTPETTGIINQQIQTGGDSFSPFNPDPNKIQSVKQDPKIQANLEAIQRNQALEAMGIQDPFASEMNPGNEYYGDMMEIDLSPGKQSMFAKAKQGMSSAFGKVKGMMDNPVSNAISFAVNPLIGGVKGIASFANKMLPTNERAFAENAAGNLGIRVDDIGRIVNMGNYLDPNNIMAGYNLNLITPKTFQKRIDRIRRGRLSDEKKAQRIKILQEAQQKIEAAQKLARLQAEQANLAKGRAPSGGRFDGGSAGYTDPATGIGGGQFTDSLGNTDYQDAYNPGGGEKDGGIIGYQKGGLATMFTRRR